MLFRYDVEEPFLSWAVVGADGRVSRAAQPIQPVDRGYMVHDCAITEHHLVLFLGPAVFDLAAMSRGRTTAAVEAGARHAGRGGAPRP